MEDTKDIEGENTPRTRKGHKRERGERKGHGDNRKPSSRSGAPKTTGSVHQPAVKNDENRADEDVDTLLAEALSKFPGEHDTDQHDSQDLDMTLYEQEMRDFEANFRPRFEFAASRTQFGRDNLLHIITRQSWPRTPKEAAFIKWFLRQPKHHRLLRLENGLGSTPMHNAFSLPLEPFVNIVLEAEGLDIISILKRKCSKGNCIHLAIEQSYSKLSDLIDKCAKDVTIFMGDDSFPEDTPLHVAVRNILVPTRNRPGAVEGVQVPEEGAEMVAQDDDLGSQHSDGDDGSELYGSDGSYDEGESEFSEGESEFSDYVQSPEPENEVDPDNNDARGYMEEMHVFAAEDYVLESEAQRKERLKRILHHLDKDTARPRPPSRTQNAHVDYPLHIRTDVSTMSSSWVQDDSTADPVDLPLDHSVCLLMKVCPGALGVKNKYGRTPYQEREHVLLNDPLVQKLVKEYAEMHAYRGGAREARETRAKREIVVRDPISHYLRSFCMRKSESRDEIMKRLYKPGQEYHIEFDLSGMPTPVVTLEYLAQLEKHLKFESILKYVALPLLSVDTGRVGNSKSPAPRLGEMQYAAKRNGRSDLVAIFDWLWHRGVREIIKVMVSDDGEVPHADEAIVDALYGFKVREWEWKRVDLCSDVICEASPAVREISLYSSGSSAVLMGWASEHGIGNRNKFPLLETVNLYMQEGLEYPARRSQNNKNFRDRVIKYGGRGPSGNLIKVVLLPDSNPSKLSSELSTTEPMEDAPSWLKSTWDFATFLLNASKKRGQGNQVPPVKIAIIDDGIDATQYDLQSKIAGGASFFPYPHSSELVNSYYVPRGQHGTLMAQLICSICPDAQLYIARLEELPTMTGGDRLVTARSAAKAVDWAVNCGVNIISMSWTIQTHTTDSDDMKAFKTALEKADTANILLFGSANDQGATNQQDYFPGCWSQCIRIGGATFTGEKLAWVDKNAEYWFPGRNVPFPSKDGKSVLYESGSSVATAAATGLAGLLIYSARLLSSSAANDSPQSQDPNDRKGQFQDFQDRKVMTKAFKTMAQGEDGRFPRTDDMLNTMFKSHVQRETGKSISNIDISKLKWNRDHAKALTCLIVQIQGYPFS